jgi:hypothetical protein
MGAAPHIDSSLHCRVQMHAGMHNGKGVEHCPQTQSAPASVRAVSMSSMSSLVDGFDAPARWLSLEPPSQTPSRVPAAAHRVEALTAATVPQLAVHGLRCVVMQRVGPHTAGRTLCCAAEQQRRRGGCLCWLQVLRLHAMCRWHWQEQQRLQARAAQPELRRRLRGLRCSVPAAG